MTTFLSLLAKIFQNKWVRSAILIIASVIVLYLCAASIRDSIYQEGYGAGIAYQVQVDKNNQAKAKQQFDVLQAQADKDRTDLNKQITSLSATNKDLREQLDKKERKTNQEKTDYAKTSAGSMSCFAPRDDGLRIINESFPTDSN
jgi:hypothetical protein